MRSINSLPAQLMGIVSLAFLCAYATSGERRDAKPASAQEKTAAEKQRQMLDQVSDVEITDLSLDKAVNQIREQTGLNLMIDPRGVRIAQQFGNFGGMGGISGLGVGGGIAGNPGFPGFPGSLANLHVSGTYHGVPLRTALTKMLRDHNLTHVLVSDTVIVTTTDKAIERQLEQPVSLHVENLPLRDALHKLARETGANVILDPRAEKESQTKLTLVLDEVPLATAVDVLADEAGLGVARLSNVLYVTSETRAKALRKRTQPPLPTPPSSPAVGKNQSPSP